MTRFLAAVLAVALVALGAYCWWLHGRVGQEAELRRAAEARELEALGLVVTEKRSREELEHQAAALTEHNASLAAELARARKASPGAHVVATVAASTGPVATSNDPAAIREHNSSTSTAPCLLTPGDRAEVRVEQVELETRAANHVIVGTATAYRLDPEARLFGGPFSAPVTRAYEEPPPVCGCPTWKIVAGGAAGMALGGLAGYGLGKL